ncbi:protein of unknown function DUF452 [Spirochaeta thermophila DSM 6578]|uniref:Uncharacterized protein n=1 Tax=Winmispira thermophila (strain ATCC 700085 / DSM 6578 / Z-1203) TaxID=869211 RepID=G0GBM6_WINT7|nr:pimeloyl-ACP methyl esterase BioG family protein [Spirochaeta thermophila]AEJ61104.1 protein of unknown function DUF452 [Spirochaeta thermophila DSM 6578]
MKVYAINPHREEIIVCFLGCGMNEQAVAPLGESTSKGIIVLYDYTTLSFPPDLEEDLRGKKVWLIAWSMGVWAAIHTWYHTGITPLQAIALMGTPFGIHKNYGIPPSWFLATLRTCSDPVREEFLVRAGITNSEAMRPTEEWKQELKALWNYREKPKPELALFTHAVIGKNDIIFPPEAQDRAWSKEGIPYVVWDLPHYPFNFFTSWEDILDVPHER